MLVRLHSQATTTPKIRAAIQASIEPAWVLAERLGTTEQTIWKWRKHDSVQDRSYTPPIVFRPPPQEAVAVALQRWWWTSIDSRRPLHNRRFTPLLGFGMFALGNLRRFYGPIFA